MILPAFFLLQVIEDCLSFVGQRGQRIGDIGHGLISERLLKCQPQVAVFDRLLFGVDNQFSDTVIRQPAAQ